MAVLGPPQVRNAFPSVSFHIYLRSAGAEAGDLSGQGTVKSYNTFKYYTKYAIFCQFPS